MTETQIPLRWLHHYYKINNSEIELVNPPEKKLRSDIEPWLSAVFQSEHLSLLVGNGLTTALSCAAGVKPVSMGFELIGSTLPYAEALKEAAENSAVRLGRGTANIEDYIRSANQLIAGLQMVNSAEADSWRMYLNDILTGLRNDVLTTENGIAEAVQSQTGAGLRAKQLLTSFLLSFANRATSRERLHVFTTNYDRVVEFGCDLAGLRVVDRFVGSLTPVFRSARVEVDMHYNPPGIRGEPRFLEGVIRLTKLHGSIDWRSDTGALRRFGIPFGAGPTHPDLPQSADSVLIYPNAAKDIETTDYPYAELFRDFSAALSRPNSVLVTYGYGFGDDHINRVIRDMLSIPSTHLVIIAFDDAFGRIPRFYQDVWRRSQVSILTGTHLGALENLVDHYLPKPGMDPILARRTNLLRSRGEHPVTIDGATAANGEQDADAN